MPTISVIMSTHNGESTLKKSIDSILNQTLQDFEFIICDDASTDNTYELLKGYQEDARFVILKNDYNQGLANSLNKCISVSKGVFLARMDDDDYSYPNRFEKEIQFLNEHKEYAYVSSIANAFDGKKEYGVIYRPERPKKEDFLTGSPYIHPAVMFRRKALEAVSGYSEKPYANRRSQDHDLFMRLTAAGYYGYNIQEPLLRYFFLKSDAQKKRSWRVTRDNIILRFNGYRALKIKPWQYVYVLTPVYVYIKYKLFYLRKNR